VVAEREPIPDGDGRALRPAAIWLGPPPGRIDDCGQQTAIGAVVDAAVDGIVDGREVLVMAPTNRVVEQINETVTGRLLAAGHREEATEIVIGGHRFYVGQPVVTRANDRRLTHGLESEQWVRNGDRWTVLAGSANGLHPQHRNTGHHQVIPATYVEAGHVSVDYASTIHRAQGATVDEAHLLLTDHTDRQQLYVGATRGRAANHIHAHPAAFDTEHHGPTPSRTEWSPADAVTAALERANTRTTALDRRRQLRSDVADGRGHDAGLAATPEQPMRHREIRRSDAGLSV
jgi:ATP-dependent exoDNAse (exonuclease V) alpha subunit